MLPEFRGTAVGTRAFNSLLSNRSGIWELNVMTKNEAGQVFWENALASAGVAESVKVVRDGQLVHRFSHKS